MRSAFNSKTNKLLNDELRLPRVNSSHLLLTETPVYVPTIGKISFLL